MLNTDKELKPVLFNRWSGWYVLCQSVFAPFLKRSSTDLSPNNGKRDTVYRKEDGDDRHHLSFG